MVESVLIGAGAEEMGESREGVSPVRPAIGTICDGGGGAATARLTRVEARMPSRACEAILSILKGMRLQEINPSRPKSTNRDEVAKYWSE